MSSTDAQSNSLLAICLDRKSGKVLWKKTVAKGIRKDQRSSFAAPTPATDGNVAVFFYGNGDLVAYDFRGKEQWSRNIEKDYGPFAFLWTFSSSPLLYDGKLYLQVLQRDVPVQGRGLSGKRNDSYLLAMNPKTGKTLWRQIRPSDAQQESREAFSSPIPFESRGRKELLIVGGDDLTGHAPSTGEELWRWGTWNQNHKIPHWRHVPSPITGGGVILVCAPKGAPVYAIKSGGRGRLGNNAVAWTSRKQREFSSDVPTPAFYDGDFFVLSSGRRTLSRVDPKTGRAKWMVRSHGRAKYEASPLVADGKIYSVNFDGDVSVVDAKNGKTINVISMENTRGRDVVRSSIIAAQGQLFVRTTNKLYCVGVN